MFRDRVVGHYVGRGYRVDTDAVLEGASGTKHKVDLMATDDLGRIAVWWGDRDAFEGPELESVKRAARDLNAAPAIAAPEVTATLRDNARRHGVVVVDEPLLEAEAATMVADPLPPRPLSPRTVEQEVAYPPWPDPSKGRGAESEERPTRRDVEAPWRRKGSSGWPDPDAAPTAHATDGTEPDADASRRSFDWLPEGKEAPAGPASATRPPREALMPPFWKPVLVTAVVLLVILLALAFIL